VYVLSGFVQLSHRRIVGSTENERPENGRHEISGLKSRSRRCTEASHTALFIIVLV